MLKKNAVPDAWDDDWETQADKIASDDAQQQPEPEPEAPKTKAERLAQHAESNRKLWESAESPETFHFLEASNSVPLASSFKPQVKVLSRKPMIAKKDPVTGMSQMTLDDDNEGADTKKEVQLSPEEIRAKQRRDREEKQRRYEEARAKIFGESAPSSGASSPGAVTPPRSDGPHAPRGRGRGRGGRGNNSSRQFDNQRQDNQRQNNQPAPGRELYDPNYSVKPESPQSRGTEGDGPSRTLTPRNEGQAIRAPRGPDGSGRGGFGFARRGAKET